MYQTEINLSTSAILILNLPSFSMGSVLWSFSFHSYLMPLGLLLRGLGLFFYFYANDTRIYLSCSSSLSIDTLDTIINAYFIIQLWFFFSLLKINHEKTKVLLVDSPPGDCKVIFVCKALVPSLKLSGSTPLL